MRGYSDVYIISYPRDFLVQNFENATAPRAFFQNFTPKNLYHKPNKTSYFLVSHEKHTKTYKYQKTITLIKHMWFFTTISWLLVNSWLFYQSLTSFVSSLSVFTNFSDPCQFSTNFSDPCQFFTTFLTFVTRLTLVTH